MEALYDRPADNGYLRIGTLLRALPVVLGLLVLASADLADLKEFSHAPSYTMILFPETMLRT